ncbi:hypothetical protein FGB62_326g04 [Gracilaria domingensis]|nr:hypothetical protein FGB62_326g04 [Gracilaria domingensis]
MPSPSTSTVHVSPKSQNADDVHATLFPPNAHTHASPPSHGTTSPASSTMTHSRPPAQSASLAQLESVNPVGKLPASIVSDTQKDARTSGEIRTQAVPTRQSWNVSHVDSTSKQEQPVAKQSSSLLVKVVPKQVRPGAHSLEDVHASKSSVARVIVTFENHAEAPLTAVPHDSPAGQSAVVVHVLSVLTQMQSPPAQSMLRPSSSNSTQNRGVSHLAPLVQSSPLRPGPARVGRRSESEAVAAAGAAVWSFDADPKRRTDGRCSAVLGVKMLRARWVGT